MTIKKKPPAVSFGHLLVIFLCIFGLSVALSGCGQTAAAPAPTSTSTASPTISPTTSPTPTPTTSPTATPRPTATATAVAAYATGQPTATPTVGAGVLETLQSTVQFRLSGSSGSSCDIQNVVIISIDGLRPDALDQAETPNIDALRVNGAYTSAAQAVLPSVTLVNHASMLGGMGPDKHGIDWNVNDAALGKIEGPTLFSLAHEAGLSTAMVVGKPKLEAVVLPDSVDAYIYAGFTDRQVIAETLPLLNRALPNVLVIHLPDVDSAGHATGWMSLNQLRVIGETDALIGDVVARLEEAEALPHTLLILTSDHGGKGTRHGDDIPENMTIPWLAVGPGVPVDTRLIGDVTVYDTAATALHALGLPLPDIWDGQPVLEIFNQVECTTLKD